MTYHELDDLKSLLQEENDSGFHVLQHQHISYALLGEVYRLRSIMLQHGLNPDEGQGQEEIGENLND